MPRLDLIVPIFFLAYLCGVVAFLRIADKSQIKPCVLGWLVPGLGHWIVGRRDRALYFGLPIFGLLIAGLALSDFRCVSPFDRHPIWALVQIPAGGPFLLATAATAGLRIESDSALYPVGCVYFAVGCLLNIVALGDVYDVTEPQSRREARETRAKAP